MYKCTKDIKCVDIIHNTHGSNMQWMNCVFALEVDSYCNCVGPVKWKWWRGMPCPTGFMLLMAPTMTNIQTNVHTTYTC